MIDRVESLLSPEEIKHFSHAIHEYSDRCIRVRHDRKDRPLPFETAHVPWFGDGFWIQDSSVRPGGWLAYAVADYYIQDAASMLPIRLANIQPEDAVCDVCAAPGGKASAVAERLGPHGFLIANEAIRSRVDVLRHSLARTGRANYATCNLDPEALQLRCRHLFNKVLLDVPCSGQSLLGKDKQDGSAFAAKHVGHCAARAQRILRSTIDLLRPGGLLVFSTCTFSIEENESQIEWLHQQYPGAWEPVDVPDLRAWRSPLAAGCYRLWPHRDRCSGGFAAALRLVAEVPRNETGSTNAPPPVRSRRAQGCVGSQRENRDAIAALSRFLDDLGERKTGCVFEVSDRFASWMEPGIAQLLAVQDVSCSPASAALRMGKHFEPTYALAMANRELFQPMGGVELDDALARRFMAGEAIPRDGAGIASPLVSDPSPRLPWLTATWQGSPLGWLKAASGRYNNHLPAWGRIRIDF